MPRGPADTAPVANATQTYLGRLVPLTRAIWLADDRQSLILANGLEYSPYPAWRESSATIVTREVKGQPTREVLRGSVERAAWRALHSLTVKAVLSQNPVGGPAALLNLSDEESFDLWVGGLVAKQAKPVDTIESVLHVPAAMLGEPSQAAYEKGVRHADGMAFRVMRALSAYHKELGDNLDRAEMRNRRQLIQSIAASQFWTDIENEVPRLLKVAAEPGSLGLKPEWHKTPWGKSVWRAALDAYESACPHETPRQIRAYAIGLRALVAAPGERPALVAGEEDEE
jgi:CRISPR system Cascade subunit CasA